MKSLVESIISSNNASIIPDIEIDNFSRNSYDDETWKALIAAVTYLVNKSGKVKLTKITVKRSIYNEGWIEIYLEYSGRKMNRSNNLWAALRLKDAIKGLMSKLDCYSSDRYLVHEIRDKTAEVRIDTKLSLSRDWHAEFDWDKDDDEPIAKLKNSIKI